MECLFVVDPWLEFTGRTWNRTIGLSGRIQGQTSNINSRAAVYACDRRNVIITPTNRSVGRGFVCVFSCATVVIVVKGRLAGYFAPVCCCC